MHTGATKPETFDSLMLCAEAALALAEAYQGALGAAIARGAGAAEVADLAASLRAAGEVCAARGLALFDRANQLAARAGALQGRSLALAAAVLALAALPAA